MRAQAFTDGEDSTEKLSRANFRKCMAAVEKMKAAEGHKRL